jgi:hypothetical protein
VQQVAGDDRVRRVRLRLQRRTPGRDRIALVRPQARETEVELHDRESWIQLRQLLEARERLVGPVCEREADLRLQRVVPGEEGRCLRRIATRIERLRLRQIACLGIGAEAEGERERRPSWTESRRRRGRRRGRAAVRGEHRHRHDRSCSECHGADEKSDTTPCGHRVTIAVVSKL